MRIGVTIGALFVPKLKLFVLGRKNTFTTLETYFTSNTAEHIWIHCASLGEFILAEPLIERIKKETNYKIAVSFFSPSGFEARKNHPLIDLVFYIPIDTRSDAQKLVSIINPELVVFSKYDFWIHHINAISSKNIPIIAISCYFNSDQIYFKWFGGFYRNALKKINCFFVIDDQSQKLLNTISINNVTIAGDNRYDKVIETSIETYKNEIIEEFKEDEPLLIVGSSWNEDIDVIVDLINKKNFHCKVIFAPHDVSSKHIEYITNKLKKDYVIYSKSADKCLHCHQILIIDTIGILAKSYRYANIAYVGGAFKQGLHNILEPISYGLPVICGPKINRFPEAILAQKEGSLFSISTAMEFETKTLELLNNSEKRNKIKAVNQKICSHNKGATSKIFEYISQNLL